MIRGSTSGSGVLQDWQNAAIKTSQGPRPAAGFNAAHRLKTSAGMRSKLLKNQASAAFSDRAATAGIYGATTATSANPGNNASKINQMSDEEDIVSTVIADGRHSLQFQSKQLQQAAPNQVQLKS